MGNFNILRWYFLQFLIATKGFPANLLYEHENIGSYLPKADDVSSAEIKLRIPFVFYGQSYSSIFVNSNGLLSFQTDIPAFFNVEFPLDYSVIAPLYSNIDISKTGTISYYETSSPELLARATRNIRQSFSYSQNFTPSSLFIVTWTRVGYHKNGVDKLNTFQVIIASDGSESFVEFLYPENGIQWIQGTGSDSGLPDARAQAGFIAADGRFHLLHGSGTDQIKNLERWSNSNVQGQWLYRVGRLAQGANIEEPDVYNNVVENDAPKSCERGASICHAFAKCIDYSDGFCCSCRELYYGNGKFCIKKDAPIRVNGKVNGKINDEKLINLDLQSYIVMLDGRAYTAISKIPESISYNFQSLQTIGGTLGWVFAKPVADTLNGFELTGGVFNYTGTITFPSTNQKVVVKQKYLGLDVYDQLRLEIDVQGEIPRLTPEAKINMDDYEEQYTLTGPGIIQSSSTKFFTYKNLNQESVSVEFNIDQTIIFNYCKFKTTSPGTTWRSKASKNFISYESREQLVRFGLSNKISPLGDFDPCIKGKTVCGKNSACVVENDSFACVCNPGYQHIYKENGEAECDDVNECQTGSNDCDYSAQCINTIGGYSCVCNPGYEGNGYFCESAQTCRNVQCPENSECIDNGVAVCQCLSGFTGNGQTCIPIISRSCHMLNNCSPYGYCALIPQTSTYACFCLQGYYGDGYSCEKNITTLAVTTEAYTEEPITAQCQYGSCWCPHGYEKQGDNCMLIVETTTLHTTTVEVETETEQVSRPEVQCFKSQCFCPRGFQLEEKGMSCLPKMSGILETMGFSGYTISCNVLNNCHKNAQCIFELSTNSYQCICNIGFEGNGYYCLEPEVPCSSDDNCDVHATCIYNESLRKSVCVCDSSYQGNGRECRRGGCTSNDQCPPNEQCVYSNVNQVYECICKEGLDRDSQQQCVKLAGTCGGGICVENAECFFDDVQQINYCKCKADFEGDGITDCRPKPIDCNVANNCDGQARCLYLQDVGRYQCICNEGYVGDGLFCHIERNCQNDPYMCHPRAMCIRTTNNKFVCECQPGYQGNGTVCTEIPRPEGNFLFLNQGKATLRIPFESTPKNFAKLTYINEFQTAVGLDIDCILGRVYWSDIAGGVIKSSNYNGSGVVDFISFDIGSPEGLSVDWVSRNIYWTDSTKDTIEVANVDTKLRTTLFNTSLVNPRGIAVHPQRGKIFWTDWDRHSPKIEWANADGTEREIFLKGENVKLPNSLVIDFDMERLCYTDAGTKKIECVDIDSRNPYIIADNCTYPFGITVTNEHIYWSDWVVKKIERVDKRTLQRLKPLEVPLGGTNKLYGLVAVPQHCIGLVNVCQYYKSQCPVNHICLPNGSGSRRCLCGYEANSPSEKMSCN